MKMSKILRMLLANILVISLSFMFFGCSNQSEQEVMQQLQEENEELRKELNAAIANSEKAEPSIEEGSENPSTQSKTELTESDIIPPQCDSNDLLVGEWFYQKFHEEEMNNWIQSLVFNPDGTGTIIRTFYLPKDLEDYSSSDFSGEVSLEFSWSLESNVLHTEYEGNGGKADYTVSFEQQQIIQKEENSSIQAIYTREMPFVPEKYIKVSILQQNIKSEEMANMRRFLGNWYFDVLLWTFNDDGTGVMNIPELGQQPATQRTFTYSISGDAENLLMTLDWSDSETTYFWPTINDDGSITLKNGGDSESITLTRKFDKSNCPLTKEILSNTIGVLSGSIFSEILPS